MKTTRIAAAGLLALCLTFAGTAPAQAIPAAGPAKVVLTATMSKAATVTWTGNGAQAQNTRTKTWTRTFNRHRYTYYSVSAFSVEDGAKVGCTIKLNGKVIRHKSVTGDYASVNCSYTKLG